MLAFQENVELIAMLFEQGQLHRRLELGTPAGCSREDRADPTDAIAHMRTALSGLTPSKGGWHVMQPAEYPAYAIAAGRPESVQLLQQHPVYKPLQFVLGLDPFHVAMLVGTLLDPRWYVPCEHPDRMSAMCAYLGLTPWNWERTLEGQISDTTLRCRNLWACWQPTPTQLLAADLDKPGYFLWRQFAATGATDESAFSVCRRFAIYLRWSWLEAIRPATTLEPLFVPEYFFPCSADVVAFRNHMRQAAPAPY